MKPIILLHGAIGASDQLQPLAEALSKLNYTVYSFSFSGHGKMPFQKEFGIKQFAMELKQFIDAHQLIRPTIFGYSMGGYVALYLASQQPNLLGKILTLGTKFSWSKQIAEKEIKQLDPTIMTEKVPKFAEALKTRHGAEWELVLKRTADMMMDLGNTNLLSADLLAGIENEVLIGLADNDTMVTSEETDFVYSYLKRAKKYNLANAKHPIETVETPVLAAIIGDFIR